MTAAPQRSETSSHFIPQARDAVAVSRKHCCPTPRFQVRKRVAVEGGDTLGRLFDREQRADSRSGLACHLCRGAAPDGRLCVADAGREARFGEIEELQVRIGFGEYLAQMFGGIPMSQSEILRLVRSRPVAGGCCGARDAGLPIADRYRQHGGAAGTSCRTHQPQPRTDLRQCRARRDAGSDPRRDAEILRRAKSRPMPISGI